MKFYYIEFEYYLQNTDQQRETETGSDSTYEGVVGKGRLVVATTLLTA